MTFFHKIEKNNLKILTEPQKSLTRQNYTEKEQQRKMSQFLISNYITKP